MQAEEFYRLKTAVLEDVDLECEIDDTQMLRIIREHCRRYAREHMLPLHEREALEQQLFFSLRKLDVLQDLLDDQPYFL